MPSTSPRLWLVATPIGNLGDLSPRAREALAAADLVLAEDTRRAGLLFQRAGLKPARLLSFYEHNEESRAEEVLAALRAGAQAALISDAGTPLLSDPGFRLVRRCRREGVEVTVVPGPSAILAALVGSGLPPQPFLFLGFAPRRKGDLRQFFAEAARFRGTLVFFERKDRLFSTLEVACGELGPRELCLARELTKTHEEFILGRLEQWQALQADLLGEITVVVGPPEEELATPEQAVLDALREEQARGGRPREIAARVRGRVHGWTAKAVYELMRDRRGVGNDA